MFKLVIKPIKDFYAIVAIATLMFSAACLTNENSLTELLVSGIVIVCCSVLTILKNGLTVQTIFNRGTVWLLAIYILIEIYGLFFLRMGTFNGDLYLFKGIRIFFIAAMLYSLKSFDRAFNVLLKGLKVAILISAVYMFISGVFSLERVLTAQIGSRLGSELTGNVNITSLTFSIMFFPVFFSVIQKKSRNIWGIICCVVAVAIILFTGSKKGLIAVIWAILLIIMIEKSVSKYFIVPLLIAGGIYAIQNVPWLYNIIGSRVQDLFATFGIGEAATAYQSTANRYNFIVIGLKSFLNVPIFGGGINYFQYINNVYAYSHCNYVEVLNSFGVLGFAIFYSFPISVLIKLRKNCKICRHAPKAEGVFCLMYLALIGVLDFAMVSFAGSGVTYIPCVLGFLLLKDKGKICNA
ncbi:MAG: hypothetical protein IJX67_02775 [Oscillospiraceae bacterium]|nr:hypothetical protein [Prevotella sp.]MBQ9167317.1 hypothetical protein [Oscillospiraceae bacterium]